MVVGGCFWDKRVIFNFLLTERVWDNETWHTSITIYNLTFGKINFLMTSSFLQISAFIFDDVIKLLKWEYILTGMCY